MIDGEKNSREQPKSFGAWPALYWQWLYNSPNPKAVFLPLIETAARG
jgi:hypothetical protein